MIRSKAHLKQKELQRQRKRNKEKKIELDDGKNKVFIEFQGELCMRKNAKTDNTNDKKTTRSRRN